MASPANVRLMRLLSCLLLMSGTLSARAVDFAPMGGLRFGGELKDASDKTARSLTIDSTASYGGIVDLPLPTEYGSRAVELYFSRQQATLHGGEFLQPPIANLNVSILHLGLVDTVPADDPRLSWLLIGTAGATRFETNAGNNTRPSVGLGGGVLWMAGNHVGLRGDLRALVNFTGGSRTALVCNGGCKLFYSGTVLLQGEASIGVVLRF